MLEIIIAIILFALWIIEEVKVNKLEKENARLLEALEEAHREISMLRNLHE